MQVTALLALAATVLAAPVSAGPVTVRVRGRVESNGIRSGPLAAVVAGDPAELSLVVDSDSFVDNPRLPTRGYAIDPASLSWTLGAVAVGLEAPFPAGMTPYFVLRDDDPAVDGFFLSTELDFDSSLPLDEPGRFGAFGVRFAVTYLPGTLGSLDILDALGTYGVTGLSVYGHAVTDGPADAMLVEFLELTIEGTPLETLLYRASVSGIVAGWKEALPLPLGPGLAIDSGWPLSFPIPGRLDDATGLASGAALLLYRALDGAGAALANELRLSKAPGGTAVSISY